MTVLIAMIISVGRRADLDLGLGLGFFHTQIINFFHDLITVLIRGKRLLKLEIQKKRRMHTFVDHSFVEEEGGTKQYVGIMKMREMMQQIQERAE